MFRELRTSRGVRLLVGIAGSFAAASSLFLPWIPIVRSIGFSNGYHGIPGFPHIEFFSGSQILPLALGGSLLGRPHVVPPNVVEDEVFGSPWLVLAPTLVSIILLGMLVLMLAARPPRLLMVMSRTVATLGLLALAFDALIVFTAASLAYEFYPDSTFAAALAFAGMAVAYAAMLIAGFAPRQRRDPPVRTGAAVAQSV